MGRVVRTPRAGAPRAAASLRGRGLRDALEGERGTMGCSLRYVVMQPPLRRVAASVACGCRLNSAIETNKLGAPVVYDFKAGCPAAER